MVLTVIMDRVKTRNLVLLTFLLNIFFVQGYDDGGREDHHQPHKLSLFNMLKTYCGKIKALVHQAHAYFFPPSIDFRSSYEATEDAGGRCGVCGGATEKVKEAAASSLSKSKQTFEDSARTAAKIAGETMEKVKDKVKKTFSKRNAQPEPEL